MGMSPVRFHLGQDGTIFLVRVFFDLKRSGQTIGHDR